MKVRKRNFMELFLQCIVVILMIVPSFCVTTERHYSFDGLEYEYVCSDSLITASNNIFILILGICGVVLFLIQLLAKNKNRNFLPTVIVVVLEFVLFLISSSMVARFSTPNIIEGSLGIAFYVMLVALLILNMITIIGYVLAGRNGIKDESLLKIKNSVVAPVQAAVEYGEAYRSLAMHVFLCIITFNVWYLIWLYKTTKFLNKTPGCEQYSPVNKLLLCMFVPMYQTYWFYKHGAKVDAFCQHKGMQNSYLAIICALIPIPIVSSVIMQDKINQICTTK